MYVVGLSSVVVLKLMAVEILEWNKTLLLQLHRCISNFLLILFVETLGQILDRARVRKCSPLMFILFIFLVLMVGFLILIDLKGSLTLAKIVLQLVISTIIGISVVQSPVKLTKSVVRLARWNLH